MSGRHVQSLLPARSTVMSQSMTVASAETDGGAALMASWILASWAPSEPASRTSASGAIRRVRKMERRGGHIVHLRREI